MRTFLIILFSLGIQTVADQNDQIIKELGHVKVDVENVKTEVENVKTEVENVKTEVGNVKSELENVKVEVENVKVQVEDFKNQVSADMSKLGKALNEVLEILKTDGKDSSSKKDTSEIARVDPFPCFRSTKDSTCLDGIPIGINPIDRALVTVKNGGYAGDTGIGYYKPDGKYYIIWKRAGEKQFNYNYSTFVVYKCDGDH